jgi:putative oxidoreductase
LKLIFLPSSRQSFNHAETLLGDRGIVLSDEITTGAIPELTHEVVQPPLSVQLQMAVFRNAGIKFGVFGSNVLASEPALKRQTVVAMLLDLFYEAQSSSVGDNMPGNSSNDLFRVVLNSDAIVGPLLLVARVFMAAVFVIFGTYKIIYNAKMKGYMKAHGVPGILIYLVVLVQIGGGILVVLGYQTRFAAFMLAGFCIVAPLLFHTDFKNGVELAHFAKDFAIAGGFLFMLVYGPGPLSLDDRVRQVNSNGQYQNRSIVRSDAWLPAVSTRQLDFCARRSAQN